MGKAHDVQGRPAKDLFQPVFIIAFGGVALIMFGLAQPYARLRAWAGATDGVE